MISFGGIFLQTTLRQFVIYAFLANLQHCKFCNRYLVPPSSWQFAELESKELLSLCLRRVKPQLTNVRLVDASFIWTEPHSKRVKVKLTVQKEVFTNAVLQQSFVIEYVICGQVIIFDGFLLRSFLVVFDWFLGDLN